ncbi:rod shape-determining protein MreD [Microcoleus sp. FACHB-672]|uniref:rod shape-determining protein MreD n=1 Tax=Microcoleus sp. FACHB-672 TaxID=2692825 RepID=UPI001682793D|nr:rod shape-determining protein MreD [Microcoleus sp. FACHB-672]MBD2040455.1 rod shape-determining protein MreD [Microcoleus sp. FACHB-672]
MRTSSRRSRVSHWHPQTRRLLNALVTVGSVLLCLLILPTRIPGMALLGIGPNWLLIWVVAWSVKRTAFLGAAAGFALGLLQDGMTASHPTHALSLAVVGILTARLQKQRYVQEDFISVALIVFGMAILAETVTAIQYSFYSERTLAEIWNSHQLVALSSAILSSLWAPVVYFPLNRWWERIRSIETP